MESIDALQKPKTLRVSNSKMSLEELRGLFERIIFAAVKESFIKRLSDMGQLPPKKASKVIKLSSRDLEIKPR